MAKKSAAKIRRNASRAATRGEEYTPPEPTTNSETDADVGGGESDEVVQAKSNAAHKLETALAALQPDLNAKERRSAKRKAEAIAVEESGCADVTKLMEWYARHKASSRKKNKKANTAAVSRPQPQLSEEEQAIFDTAKKLHTSLSSIENDTNLNAKERRSAKRKAEAIASEETGGRDTTELLQWYESIAPPPTTTSTTDPESTSGKKIPYIIFVGQLSYTTTTEMLYQHFQSTLGPTLLPTQESMKIRLLTDPKNKNKSRGMAFLELDSPELMYECLKLHLTFLDGRRINVERSAGGGTASKKARITSYREHQSQYISETIDNILTSFTKNGDIEKEELDEGVIALCKRHSASVVEAALREYVEEKKERKIKYEESLRDGSTAARKKAGDEEEGLEFRNPSAFLTHMIGRIAEEGIGNSSKGSGGSSTSRKRNSTDNTGGRGGGAGRGRSDGGRGGGGGRGSGADGHGGGGGGGLKSKSSILQRSGVDMSISSRRRGGDGSSKIEQIFPSMSRGRGRGRGYM